MFHEYGQPMLRKGAKVADIDGLFRFGWVGFLAVNDLAGNDVGWRIRKDIKRRQI